MKFTAFNNLLLLSSILFLCFCSSTSLHNKREFDLSFFNHTDSIIIELPKEKNGEISNQYLLKKMREKSAGLSSLENGFDSIKMRFWYRYGYNDTIQIIEIANSCKKWAASQCDIKCNFTNDYDTFICGEKTVINSDPKSGWENFIQKLLNANILRLSGYESYYANATDVSSVGVEIATKHRYMFYVFFEPLHDKNSLGAKSMVEIMDLIEDEFKFKRKERF